MSNPQQQQNIKAFLQHDPTVIPLIINQCKRYFPYDRWLGGNNRYRINTCQNIKFDCKNSSINHKHLREYIAISSILHCYDSWKYLSRALKASIDNDLSTSCHMAYYSELRAAMSILANQGVGIFDRKHFVLSSMNGLNPMPNKETTHQITWYLLDSWSNQISARKAIFNLIKFEQEPIQNILQGFLYNSTKNQITTTLINKFGMDLRLWSSDRNARNEASYRPSINNKHIRPISERMVFVKDLWYLLEGEFRELDKWLFYEVLRYLKTLYRSKQFEAFCNNILSSLGISDGPKYNESINFMISNSTNNFVEFAKEEKQDYKNMVARAVILLRIATGFVGNIFREFSIEESDLKFWIDSINKDDFLFDSEVEHFYDLFKDVEVFFDSNEFSKGFTFPKLKDVDAYFFNKITQSEIAFLWSVFN